MYNKFPLAPTLNDKKKSKRYARHRTDSFITINDCKKLEDEAKGTRNKLLIALMWRSGLRVSEALAIKKKDVKINLETPDYSYVLVKTLKQKQPETDKVYIDSTTQEYLKKYITPLSPEQFLFRSYSKSGHLTRRRVHQIVAKLSKDADIKEENGNPVHPHTFRHSLAVYLLRKGMQITKIQSILRHQDLSSTGVYLRYDPKRIAAEYQQIMKEVNICLLKI